MTIKLKDRIILRYLILRLRLVMVWASLSPRLIRVRIQNRIARLIYETTHGLQAIPVYKGVCFNCNKLFTAHWLIGFVYATTENSFLFHTLRPAKCKCGALHVNFEFTHDLAAQCRIDTTPATSLVYGTVYNKEKKSYSVFTTDDAQERQKQAEAEQ